MPEPPDLILSGVNSGSNLADDVTYSGTVAGAMEGTMLDIRSFALSQAYNLAGDERIVPYETCEALAPALLDKLIATDLPPGVLLNINFPNCPPEEVAGTRVTAQGRLVHGTWIEERRDGRSLPYYWLRFGREPAELAEGTDIHAVRNGFRLGHALATRSDRSQGPAVPFGGPCVNQQTRADREGFAALMERLHRRGPVTRELIEALEATPRRGFVPSQWQDVAWSDRMIPIPCGEAMEGADLQLSVISQLHIEPGIACSRSARALVLPPRHLAVCRRASSASSASARLPRRLAAGWRRSASSMWPSSMPTARVARLPMRRSTASSCGRRSTACRAHSRISWPTNGIMIAPIGAAEGEQELAKLTKIGSRFDREDIAHVRLQPMLRGVAAAL